MSQTNPIRCESSVYVQALKLLESYLASDLRQSPHEFVENRHEINTEVVRIFISIMYRKHFLDEFAQKFIQRHECEAKVVMMFHIFIFEISEENTEEIYQVLNCINPGRASKILKFFFSEDNLSEIACVGCKYFENAYVLNEIVTPMLKNIPYLKVLYKKFEEYFKKKLKVHSRSPIRPKTPECLRRSLTMAYATPAPPATPIPEIKPMRPTRLPISTYKKSKVMTSIEKAKVLNKLKGQTLLEEARKNIFKCAHIKEKIIPEPPKIPKFKSSKLPKAIFESKEIKPTAASRLRDAAVVIQKKKKEIERLEKISEGGADSMVVQILEEQLKKQQYEESLKEIERKHLQGLLTREEAALAKLNLIQMNKEKMVEFKKEQEALRAELEEWRAIEWAKIQEKVENVQEIEQRVKEACQKVYEKKYENAREVEEEHRKNKLRIEAEREAEFARKIQMIADIRLLESLRSTLQMPKFDPTQTPNLGLLGEMSMAELQERLFMLRIDLEQELEERRQKIQIQKIERMQLIETAQNIVEKHRAETKAKSITVTPKITIQDIRRRSEIITPDQKLFEIESLREKLKEKRSLRMKLNETIKI